jgi:hypothetical protein
LPILLWLLLLLFLLALAVELHLHCQCCQQTLLLLLLSVFCCCRCRPSCQAPQARPSDASWPPPGQADHPDDPLKGRQQQQQLATQQQLQQQQGLLQGLLLQQCKLLNLAVPMTSQLPCQYQSQHQPLLLLQHPL